MPITVPPVIVPSTPSNPTIPTDTNTGDPSIYLTDPNPGAPGTIQARVPYAGEPAAIAQQHKEDIARLFAGFNAIIASVSQLSTDEAAHVAASLDPKVFDALVARVAALEADVRAIKAGVNAGNGGGGFGLTPFGTGPFGGA